MARFFGNQDQRGQRRKCRTRRIRNLPRRRRRMVTESSRFLGRLAFPRFPAVARAWTDQQHLRYNAAMDLIRQPPAGIRLRVFHPMKPMPVGTLTIAKKRIHAALCSGRDEALQQFAPTEQTVSPQLPGLPAEK